MKEFTVKPLGRAVFGEPQSCPKCGGELAPSFGQVIQDDGTRLPVIDPTSARCRDCLMMFKVKE